MYSLQTFKSSNSATRRLGSRGRAQAPARTERRAASKLAFTRKAGTRFEEDIELSPCLRGKRELCKSGPLGKCSSGVTVARTVSRSNTRTSPTKSRSRRRGRQRGLPGRPLDLACGLAKLTRSKIDRAGPLTVLVLVLIVASYIHRGSWAASLE